MDKPILSLAPFQGITTSHFRSVFFKYFSGYDRAYAPFLKAIREPMARSHFRDLLEESPRSGGGLGRNGGQPGGQGPYRLIPQVLTKDGNELLDTARRLAALGYTEVNINMGCPFPMVANKGRGSGILPHPQVVDKMLVIALGKSPIPISIKLRTGRSDAGEIYPILEILRSYPLAEIILHPRTGIQMYEGRADLAAFGDALALSDRSLAYNGDIFSRADWEERAALFPKVSHWMLGRGALRNPFLAREIRGDPPGPAERFSLLRAFHNEYFELQASRFGSGKQTLDIMKGLWYYLCHSLPQPQESFLALRRCKQAADYLNQVESLLQKAQAAALAGGA